MNILYFLIGCSILLALLFLGAFFWAMKDGQNDDMQTPAIRILFEEDKPVPSEGEVRVKSKEQRIKNKEKRPAATSDALTAHSPK